MAVNNQGTTELAIWSFARFPGLPASGWAGKPQPVLWSISTVLPFQTPAGTKGDRDSHEKEALLTKKGPFEPSFSKLPGRATESSWGLKILESASIWVKCWQVRCCVMVLSGKGADTCYVFPSSHEKVSRILCYVHYSVCYHNHYSLSLSKLPPIRIGTSFVMGAVQSLPSKIKIKIWNILRDLIV